MEILTCDMVEMLKAAILDEKEAAGFYEMLAEAAPDAEIRQKIINIRRKELMHFELLQEIFADITGREYPVNTKIAGETGSFGEGLKTAICGELEAAEKYAELACCLPCMRHKEQIISILNDEKCHAKVLFAIFEEMR